MSASRSRDQRPSADFSALSGVCDPGWISLLALTRREHLIVTCLAAEPEGLDELELVFRAYGMFADDARLLAQLHADMARLHKKLEFALGYDPLSKSETGRYRLEKAAPIVF